MKKLGVAAASVALVLLWGGGEAFAADLPAPPTNGPVLPEVPTSCTSLPDFFMTACPLALSGVRFYGALDGGFGYETNGARFDRFASSSVNTYLGKPNLGGRFLPTPNVLSLSNVGLLVNEPLSPEWSFVGRVEAQFDPYGFELLDGARGIHNNIGVPLALQTAAGDNNSQGTLYDGYGYAGISHKTWGTLTVGRQTTLMADAFLVYDPNTRASISPLGFFGSYAGGGDTQDSRATTAIKYKVAYQNYRFGLYAQVGGYDQGNASNGAFQGDVGGDFHVGPGVLTTDVLGGYTKDGVTVFLNGPTNIVGYPVDPYTSKNQVMSAVLSNNASVMWGAKYTIERLKLYGGYQLIEYSNPSDPYTIAGTGFNDISGDFLCFNCGASNGTTIYSTSYTHHKFQNLVWFGAKYALTPTLEVTGAYYHVSQNDFSGGGKNGAGGTCSLSSTALSSCAGALNSGAVVLDWTFLPKWDTYVTSVYERLSGGMNNGYLSNNNWSTMAGLRFRW
ncbi:MAG: porin [Pseudomonadota bacterium]